MPRILRNGFLVSVEADDPTLAAPVLTLADRKAAKMDALARERLFHETKPLTVNGVLVHMTREGTSRLDEIDRAFDKGRTDAVAYKDAGGRFHQLDGAAIANMWASAAVRVAACFERESTLASAITDAADEAALARIDITAGWPD